MFPQYINCGSQLNWVKIHERFRVPNHYVKLIRTMGARISNTYKEAPVCFSLFHAKHQTSHSCHQIRHLLANHNPHNQPSSNQQPPPKTLESQCLPLRPLPTLSSISCLPSSKNSMISPPTETNCWQTTISSPTTSTTSQVPNLGITAAKSSMQQERC